MAESGRGRGEKTRAAILDAAEVVFAEHGFDGARVDTIAEVSGYNKTLIFRYFGDKTGLYAEVLRRIDRQVNELMASFLALLFEDESIISDIRRFRAFFKTILGVFFDYIVEHPRVTRMMVWEHAEGWQTYSRLASLFDLEGIDRIEALFSRAQRAGFFRSDFDPFVLFMLAEQICWTYPTSLPFYQLVRPYQDLSTAESQARARECIIEFIIAGILVDAKDSEAEAERRGESWEQV
jgi:AcrR family transcriptional regulator